MRLDRSILVYGEGIPLPEGQYLIPCFDDLEKAKEAAGDRFEIAELEIPE